MSNERSVATSCNMNELRVDEPSVGIVVPTFNGERYLQECLESILTQDYPLTCVVFDGGSQDASVRILESFGTAVQFVSERDEGQAHAIEKGFDTLETDLIGWLNSDDLLCPGAVRRVVEEARRYPDGVLFHGDVARIDSEGKVIGETRSVDLTYDLMRCGNGRTVQPGSFYRRWAVEACGGIDRSWSLLMDVDLWIRLLQRGPAVRIPEKLAAFREHCGAKSGGGLPVGRYYCETLRLGLRYERDRLVRSMLRRFGTTAALHARWIAAGWWRRAQGSSRPL